MLMSHAVAANVGCPSSESNRNLPVFSGTLRPPKLPGRNGDLAVPASFIYSVIRSLAWVVRDSLLEKLCPVALCFGLVRAQGFEPRFMVPETSVLPVGRSPNDYCCIVEVGPQGIEP